jgi:hypothetical protein
MITKMDQSYLAAIYFSGFILAKALRFPQRIHHLRHRNTWRTPHNSSLKSEAIVLVSVVLGIWFLPLIYLFTSWLHTMNISLPIWVV